MRRKMISVIGPLLLIIALSLAIGCGGSSGGSSSTGTTTTTETTGGINGSAN